jgi:hypothetical protein
MATKTNGTVTSTSNTTAGRTATVHYDGPPPEDVTYYDLTAEMWQAFALAMRPDLKVDVDTGTGTPPPVTGVKQHY